MVLVRKKHPEFGPTFATEKLFEYRAIKISDETLRKIPPSVGPVIAPGEKMSHLMFH